MGRYLEGKTVPFRTAADRKALVGKRIQYVRNGDIDTSGRGYVFPRYARVTDTQGKNLFLSDGDALWASDLVEVVVPDQQSEGE